MKIYRVLKGHYVCANAVYFGSTIVRGNNKISNTDRGQMMSNLLCGYAIDKRLFNRDGNICGTASSISIRYIPHYSPQYTITSCLRKRQRVKNTKRIAISKTNDISQQTVRFHFSDNYTIHCIGRVATCNSALYSGLFRTTAIRKVSIAIAYGFNSRKQRRVLSKCIPGIAHGNDDFTQL